ncbi:DnaD domain protein [Neobacillus sedimentimangrovi]|uniref:DnaD domain protein n=1 Tax=Neobacillus sedimentimangrovi TaxID=2699460 RepID=UPI0013D796FB|nr:DnaD domain protein [Neobacillus sedimentimangrovi]
MERAFKGIWIPKEIWLAEDLGWTEKLLLAEIDSLSQNRECFASNEYFAKFFKISKDRVSKLISSLSNKGYVEVTLLYKPGTKQVEKRVITTIGYRRKQLEGIGENNYTPIGENAEDINTSIINTINNSTTTTTETLNPVVHFENLLCRLSPRQAENLYQWVDDFNGQTDIIIEAINIADDKNKRTYAFVEYLLREWANNRLDSLDRVRAYEQEKFNRQKLPKYYTTQKRSLFEQGEESKKRQAAIKPMTPEEEEAMRRMEEELPF